MLFRSDAKRLLCAHPGLSHHGSHNIPGISGGYTAISAGTVVKSQVEAPKASQ